ncbi:hypothetical protein J437_LFUL009565 [Ladona fulva]|uniref:KANL2-like probable zinc-finger domain-containing protein n=1 Tax=Ladona fulva TaxID=123851 RepID=A0A8K0K657_LADFU|nr:hypothetical protein J437_LFUL009565 [Ladona fulva]
MSTHSIKYNMFEGKHIHFSPIDNKPLCSYSKKICKQRRLNGYAFCIRREVPEAPEYMHILEDGSAPFKQCSFVAKFKKCTNPIPSHEERGYETHPAYLYYSVSK